MIKYDLIKASITAIAMNIAVLIPGISQSASFNCSRASNLVESLICKDASLSKKDEQMARLYNKTMSEMPQKWKISLKSEQRDWLLERDTCDDKECLEYQYSKRIYDLKHIDERLPD